MSEQVVIVQRSIPITIKTFNFAAFEAYNFTATEDGQTIFTLSKSPVGIILLAINGTAQRSIDFDLTGAVITLTEGVDAGDKVYGVMQTF